MKSTNACSALRSRGWEMVVHLFEVSGFKAGICAPKCTALDLSTCRGPGSDPLAREKGGTIVAWCYNALCNFFFNELIRYLQTPVSPSFVGEKHMVAYYVTLALNIIPYNFLLSFFFSDCYHRILLSFSFFFSLRGA